MNNSLNENKIFVEYMYNSLKQNNYFVEYINKFWMKIVLLLNALVTG